MKLSAICVRKKNAQLLSCLCRVVVGLSLQVNPGRTDKSEAGNGNPD